MHMHALDWSIVAGLLVVLFVGALRTRKYTRSVSAFLAAERCGGRYLISMANAMAGLGVISLVYWFEIYYEAGYTAYWWGAMTEPALVILALSGWVIYRFRSTRSLTLDELVAWKKRIGRAGILQPGYIWRFVRERRLRPRHLLQFARLVAGQNIFQ